MAVVKPDLSLLSRSEQEVVARALSLDPRQRYESCEKLFNELRKAIGVPPLKKMDDEQARLMPEAELRRWRTLRKKLEFPKEGATQFIAFERRGDQAAGWIDDQGRLQQLDCPKPLSPAHREATVSKKKPKPS
jgi:hypothetical protein